MTLRAIEPAVRRVVKGRITYPWQEVPLLFFRSLAPTCDRCGSRILWLEAPDHSEADPPVWTYAVQCECPDNEDVILSPFPLRWAATAEEWERLRSDRSAW